MPSTTALDVLQVAILIGSVILHEVSHGWAALALGDDTAKRSGRLTLNPIPHLDPIGSVLLPGILILTNAGFLFGWARPVPVNVGRLRHPRNDAVLTGLAGPATNLVLVAIAYVAIRVSHPVPYTWTFWVLTYLGLINLWLAAFNMLPIPPLDGSALLERLVPNRWWGHYLVVRQYTLPAVFLFVFLGNRVFNDAHQFFVDHWLSVTGYSYLLTG